MYQSYQQLANIYDDKICKRSYWDRFRDEQLPSDDEWLEYSMRSGLSIVELYELFQEWFEDVSSHNKDVANDAAETWKEQFDRWFD